MLQENQFYSYRSRISRGGALKQEDDQGLRGCQLGACRRDAGRAVPGMLWVPLCPHPEPAPGRWPPRSHGRSPPAAGFAQTVGFSPKGALQTRLGAAARAGQSHGEVSRKARTGPQKATQSIAARCMWGWGVIPSRPPRQSRHVPAHAMNPLPIPAA